MAATASICAVEVTPLWVVHCIPAFAQVASQETPVPEEMYHRGRAVGEMLGSAPGVPVPEGVNDGVRSAVPVCVGVPVRLGVAVVLGSAPGDSVAVGE